MSGWRVTNGHGKMIFSRKKDGAYAQPLKNGRYFTTKKREGFCDVFLTKNKNATSLKELRRLER